MRVRTSPEPASTPGVKSSRFSSRVPVESPDVVPVESQEVLQDLLIVGASVG